MNLGYDYQRLRTSIRYWLLGRGYTQACKAMDFGLEHHTGQRKDGSPEFSHQIFQAQYTRTLVPGLVDPEGTLITVFLHDVVEDIEAVTIQEIERIFGNQIAVSVGLMTNQYPNGVKKPKDAYYPSMIDDPRASLAKGIDRIHNHQSMGGVFSDEKKLAYIGETRDHILPMLKAARKRFPEQESAYQNIKHVLLTQMELIESSIIVEG